ncbi:MAG: hypothetical protein JWN86_131 [Planctomycetota bacterium]|nr:hypothetical protein [Planctomycetota bacterium]
MPIVKPTESDRPIVQATQPEADVENPQEDPEKRPPAAGTPILAPELRDALEKSWARHESAYRYLGR